MNRDVNVWKCLTEASEERQKFFRSFRVVSVLRDVVKDGVGREEPMYCRFAALVPDLIEPLVKDGMVHRV
jgi:hypothetical protein